MIKLSSNSRLSAVLLLAASIVFVGCEKKSEQTEQPKDGIQTEQTVPDNVQEIKEPVVEEKIPIPDMQGIWTGTFDGKSTTLSITEQTDSSFTGKITINYKQPLNQDVIGNFKPSNLEISMVDQLHSKYMGKYRGILSNDFKSFAGTFTKNRDGSQYSFNLKKK
jgi:hypothetical protein